MQKLTLRLFDYLKIQDVYIQIKLYAFRDTLSDRNFGLLQKKMFIKEETRDWRNKSTFYLFIYSILFMYLFILLAKICMCYFLCKLETYNYRDRFKA